MSHFADRLLDRIDQIGAATCVGIDPVYARMPESLTADQPDPPNAQAVCEVFNDFAWRVLRGVADHAAAVKFQIACFERYHAHGIACLKTLMRHAQDIGFIVILDAKRGDIGSTADHYAAAWLEDTDADEHPLGVDALTVNPYMGPDTLDPLLATAQQSKRGLFALVRTSNPSSDALQSLALADGRTVAQALAWLVGEAGAGPHLVGRRGYSLLGAVVGATKPDDIARLRKLMPQQIFLVPGYGAQGAAADDLRPCFKSDGTGALVNASRSVIYAYEQSDTDDWLDAVHHAAANFHRDLAAIV